MRRTAAHHEPQSGFVPQPVAPHEVRIGVLDVLGNVADIVHRAGVRSRFIAEAVPDAAPRDVVLALRNLEQSGDVVRTTERIPIRHTRSVAVITRWQGAFRG